MQELLENLDKIHTTVLGAERVKKNIALEVDDVVDWCKVQIEGADQITRNGKNWYVFKDNSTITVNAHSYTIITAHKNKKQPYKTGSRPKGEFTEHELDEAHRSLLSTLHKCENIDISKLGKSQQTLLERRIAALKVALILIEKEQRKP